LDGRHPKHRASLAIFVRCRCC